MKDLLEYTELAVNVLTIVGGILALVVFTLDRFNAWIVRETETYQRLQSSYSDFMLQCIDRVELGLLPYNDGPPPNLTGNLDEQRLGMIEVLVSMLESAYFHYHRAGQRRTFTERQWSGWHKYIVYWAERPDFQRAWDEHLDGGFDVDFVGYMRKVVENAKERQAEKAAREAAVTSST